MPPTAKPSSKFVTKPVMRNRAQPTSRPLANTEKAKRDLLRKAKEMGRRNH